jgi:hypothetical protein
MKKLIAVTALALTVASAAYSTDDKSADKESSMMKDCQSHMTDGKMMGNMPKDLKTQCEAMMKSGEMMQRDGMKDMKASDEAVGCCKSDTPKAADEADHAAHHPAQ